MGDIMVKRILCLSILALTLAAPSADASTISFNVSSPATVGSQLNVDVLASGIFDPPFDADLLFGFEFRVLIGNPSVVQFANANVNATYFDQTAVVAPNVGGTVNSAFGLVLMPGDFLEPLRLATLHFNVLQAGQTSVGITTATSTQGLAYLGSNAFIAGSTNVTATAPVPEPMTLLLVGPVALLARRARRRRSNNCAS
jgi:hypothetical protein